MNTIDSNITLSGALERAAGTPHGAHCISDAGEEHLFSWSEIWESARRVAASLAERGLKRGDRVAIILPTSEHFMAGFFGASLGGFVPVPMYPPLNLTQLEGYVRHATFIARAADARLVLSNAMLQPLLSPIAAGCPQVRHVLTVEDALANSPGLLEPVALGAAEPAFIQFTSGSTSRPKGVLLTHENLAANIRAFGGPDGMVVEPGKDSGVSWLPLFHDMGLIGMLLGAIYHESPVVIMPPSLFLRRPVMWLKAISRHRATISFGTNFAYGLCAKRIRDADLEGLDLSSWRVAGCGAEPIQSETLRQFAARFAAYGFDAGAFLPAYGMAEHTLASTMPAPGRGVRVDVVDRTVMSEQQRAVPCEPDAPEAQTFVGCGRAFGEHQVQIFGAHDEPLPERTVGEIVARGPSVMAGYHTQEATREALRGGWLRTGDLGYIADGELFVCGRKKELIIVNGRNCYPQDLEWAVGEVDGVRKGSVVAFGTSAFGERERIVVVAERRGALDPSTLKERILRHVLAMPGLMVDELIVVPSGTIPKTSSGKLQRARTKQRYEQGTLYKPIENKDAAVRKAQQARQRTAPGASAASAAQEAG